MGLIVFIVLVLIVLKVASPLLESVMKQREKETREELETKRTRQRAAAALNANQEQFMEYLRECSWDEQIAPWNTTYVERQLIGFGFSEFAARQKVNELLEQLGLRIEQLDDSYYIPEQNDQNVRLNKMQEIYKAMREEGLSDELAKRVFHYNFPEVPKENIVVRLYAMEKLDELEPSDASKKTTAMDSGDAHFSNPAFCAELADRIIDHTKPLIAYLMKTYPDYPVKYFKFYPIAFLIYVLDSLSLELKLMYAFNISRELAKHGEIYAAMQPEYTVDNCPLVSLLWDGMVKMYRESLEKDGKEKASAMVFVLLIANTIGKRSKGIDQNMTAMTGVGLRELDSEIKELWNKYA